MCSVLKCPKPLKVTGWDFRGQDTALFAAVPGRGCSTGPVRNPVQCHHVRPWVGWWRGKIHLSRCCRLQNKRCKRSSLPETTTSFPPAPNICTNSVFCFAHCRERADDMGRDTCGMSQPCSLCLGGDTPESCWLLQTRERRLLPLSPGSWGGGE